MFREACLKTPALQHQVVDEQVIPCKGRALIKQYLPCKRKKWGFKVFSRNGDDGVMHGFFVYDGRKVKVAESTGTQCGDYVVKLCETLPNGLNFILFMDNLFTGFELQVKLLQRQIHTVGTIRNNRLHGLRLKSDKDLRKEGRGAFVELRNDTTSLNIARWFDNRAVTLSSTCFSAQPVKSVSRRERKAKRQLSVPYRNVQ